MRSSENLWCGDNNQHFHSIIYSSFLLYLMLLNITTALIRIAKKSLHLEQHDISIAECVFTTLYVPKWHSMMLYYAIYSHSRKKYRCRHAIKLVFRNMQLGWCWLIIFSRCYILCSTYACKDFFKKSFIFYIGEHMWVQKYSLIEYSMLS